VTSGRRKRAVKRLCLAQCMGIYDKRGRAVRVSYLVAAWVRRLLSLLWPVDRGRVVVLCYHGVPAEQKERFREQMSRIAPRAISLDAFKVGRLDSVGKAPHVLVSFDDAFDNLLENALPALEDYHVPAIIFAPAGNLGSPPRWEMATGHRESAEMIMTAEQLRVLSRNPLVRVGSHTLTHPDLARIRPEQLKRELADSKHRLEQWVGRPIEDLALPFGSYNRNVLQTALEAGYKRIYTLDPRTAKPASEDPVVGRFSMSTDVWQAEFMLTCAGAYSWLSSLRRFVAVLRNSSLRRRSRGDRVLRDHSNP